MTAVNPLTLSEQLDALNALKEEAAEHQSQADARKLEAAQLEYEIFERMEAEGISSIKVNGTNFVRAETQYGQVQDRSEFIKWAEATRPELIEPKERKRLVNELVRQYLDDGTPLPPGLGFYSQRYISRRST